MIVFFFGGVNTQSEWGMPMCETFTGFVFDKNAKQTKKLHRNLFVH